MSRLASPVAVLVALASLAVAEGANPLPPAKGLAVNIPVVGRLTGVGNILFKTAIDVSNNTGSNTVVDFHLVAMAGTHAITVDGSISSCCGLVARGAEGMSPHDIYHSDDFVDDLVHFGLLTPQQEAAGILGSVRFVFDGFTKSGQGSASANFYRDLSAGGVVGTIGVSATGHEITANEPMKLVGTFRNTLGKPGPQVYPNLFINNMGVTPIGTAAATPVDVRISAFSGGPVGAAKTITGIAPGQTVVFGPVLSALSVPSSQDTVLVYVTVVSGNAAIAALAVEVDNGTHDSTSVELRRADF